MCARDPDKVGVFCIRGRVPAALSSAFGLWPTFCHPLLQFQLACNSLSMGGVLQGCQFHSRRANKQRLESINAKVKSVCSKYSSLSTFFDQFFSVLFRGCHRQPLYCFHFVPVVWLHVTDICIYIYIDRSRCHGNVRIYDDSKSHRIIP